MTTPGDPPPSDTLTLAVDRLRAALVRLLRTARDRDRWRAHAIGWRDIAIRLADAGADTDLLTPTQLAALRHSQLGHPQTGDDPEMT